MTQPKHESSSPMNTADRKPGLFARIQSAAVDNPIIGGVAVTAAGVGVAKGVSLVGGKVRDYFADKATAPAKEQAANLVSGVAKMFKGGFGK